MNAILSAADRIAIHELVTIYGVHHDRRDFENLHALFTEDATYTMRIADGTVNGPRMGPDAIVGQIREFKQAQDDIRRHHISNIQVSPMDADHAQVTSYVIVSAVKDGQLEFKTVGTYSDLVVQTDDGWRIERKELLLETTF